MEGRLADLEDRVARMDDFQRRLDQVELKMRQMEEIKDDFGHILRARLINMETDVEMKQGVLMNDLKSVVEDAQKKFIEIDSNIMGIYENAKAKFNEIEAAVRKEGSSQDLCSKKNVSFAIQMMVPETCFR